MASKQTGLFTVAAIAVFTTGSVAAASPAGAGLAGSEWELVSIQSMDDAQGALRVADPAAFTLQLGADGRAAMKLDCNRGTAPWKATPAADGNSGQITFGPVAGTRALCPPPHLDERIVRDLGAVRGYLLRDGKLYLSLKADGGIYEWRPRASAAAVLGDPAQPLAGRVLGQPVHTRDAEELRYYVLKALSDRFATAEGISVSNEEIEAYLASTVTVLAGKRAAATARRDALKQELAAGSLTPQKKAEVEREIASAERLIADLAPSTGAAAAEDRQARAEIATAFIRQWKINGALQKKYGGRIIFQQAGPEPLDATRRFLEAAQKAGDFTIANKALKKPFWAYYLDTARHSFYKPGSPEEAAAFKTPPWSAR
jgi:heat shock protein HslJ